MLSNEDVETLADAVTVKLKSSNPGFVQAEMCNQRYTSLRKVVYGIYWFLGVLLLEIIAGMILFAVFGGA